jgi:hypothetical protein
MIGGADLSSNFMLQDNDIIYVARSGLSNFNYVLRQILPALQVIDLTTNTLERFGVMPEFRKQVWGQDAYADPDDNNNPNNINGTQDYRPSR